MGNTLKGWWWLQSSDDLQLGWWTLDILDLCATLERPDGDKPYPPEYAGPFRVFLSVDAFWPIYPVRGIFKTLRGAKRAALRAIRTRASKMLDQAEREIERIAA